MSALRRLTDSIRDSIVDRFGLTQVGDPYEPLVLVESGERVGEVRVWTGPRIPNLVDTRLTVPGLGIDSVMLHAFTDSAGAVPHLTSDVAGIDGRLALGLDLTPRVDLRRRSRRTSTRLRPALSDAHAASACAIEGATPMDVSPGLGCARSPRRG